MIAELKAKARKILEQSKLRYEKEKALMELDRTKRVKDIEIKKAQVLGEIEGNKVKQYVECLGRDTLVQLAKAGPEQQAEILNSLGLKGYMIMDSNNPINLFQQANGIINQLPANNLK